MIRPRPCLECGTDAVFHRPEAMLAALDRLFSVMLRPAIALLRIPVRFFSRLPAGGFFRGWLELLGRLGAGTWHDNWDSHDALRTRALFESAQKRGILARQFRLFGQPHMSFIVGERDGRVIVFEGLPRPGFLTSKSMEWIDDKGRMKRRFKKAGFPIAKGGIAMTEGRALRIFRSLEAPVIAKPTVGSGSRHTTIHITSEPALREAFQSAKRLAPWIIVEEELLGDVYRATVIGGRLIGVVRRDPARVIGNGESSVRELVEAENRHPLRQGPIFSPLATGKDAEEELSRQGLFWGSIPARGAIVTLAQKITWSLGGTTEEVTDHTHKDNVALFEWIAAYVNDPIIGIDFIIKDISKPWTEQVRCGVIELNSMPFLDNHHYLFAGTPRDAAGAVWDLVFGRSLESGI